MSLAVLALANTLRSEADALERWRDVRGAAVLREAAARIDAAAAEDQRALLSMSEAVTESGYSERRLRQLLAAGDVPNAGQPGRPRIRRSDLPRKPGSREQSTAYDPAADARRLLTG